MKTENHEHIPFGNCEICRKTTDTIVSLPIKREDGSLNTLACESCSKESSAYCNKHSSVHIGFADNTSACVNCIENIIDNDALQIYESFSKSLEGTQKEFEILEELNEWASISSQITGDPKWISIVRSIVTVSERKAISVDDVIEKTLEKGSIFLLG